MLQDFSFSVPHGLVFVHPEATNHGGASGVAVGSILAIGVERVFRLPGHASFLLLLFRHSIVNVLVGEKL